MSRIIPQPIHLNAAERVALVSEVAGVHLESVQDGSGSSHYGGPEGWITGFANQRIQLEKSPMLELAVERSRLTVKHGPVVQVMVNRLRGGKALKTHKDGPPKRARYHLPIITNELVTWWDEINGMMYMPPMSWVGPVPYCGVLHSMTNASDVDRIHVVVDFERAP
jgi:hypothetical protein